jgi:hypothetical protein
MFYPAQAERCRAAATQLLQEARSVTAAKPLKFSSGATGVLVPHAGWICSGAIAAQGIAAAAARQPKPDVVVIFGAIHTPIPIDRSVLDSYARWAVPGGESRVSALLRDELAATGRRFAVDDRFHDHEHAVEVELPLIQAAWPSASILPIETPPDGQAAETGQVVAAKLAQAGVSAVYLASSDLTHYGPNYGFTPAGLGESAIDWAMGNDRRLLELMTQMDPQRIVPEAVRHYNACGAGAIAAMMAACQAGGARQAVVLHHTNSYQTLAAVAPQAPDNAVGYAAVMVG